MDATLKEISSKIFPGGASQLDKEVREVRALLEFKYSYDDVKRTYAHAAGIFYIADDKSADRIIGSILHNHQSIITRKDAIYIYDYLAKKFGVKETTTTQKSAPNTPIEQQMLNIAKGGIVEIKSFKELSNSGKYEILIFNSYFILNTFQNSSFSDKEIVQSKYLNALINEAKNYDIDLSPQALMQLIIERIQFHTSLISNAINGDINLPGNLYILFYVKPLIPKPYKTIDGYHIQTFQPELQKMINWVIKYSAILMPKSSSTDAEPQSKSGLEGFQEEYTQEQKAAIIRCLWVILQADNEKHPIEMKYLKDTAQLLDIDFKDPILLRLLNDKTKFEMLTHLKTLSTSQKEWFVVAIHGMMICDGNAADREFNYILGICGEIGITEEMYISIIEKTEALQKKVFGTN